MAQRGSFQIDDIRIAKKDNVFLMDIDATLDERSIKCLPI